MVAGAPIERFAGEGFLVKCREREIPAQFLGQYQKGGKSCAATIMQLPITAGSATVKLKRELLDVFQSDGFRKLAEGMLPIAITLQVATSSKMNILAFYDSLATAQQSEKPLEELLLQSATYQAAL